MAKRFYKREFLNNPDKHSGAFIIAKVVKGTGNWVEGSLKLSDCDRIVDLDFSGGNSSSRANVEYKVDLLYETVKDFRRNVKAELRRAEKEKSEE